MQLYSVVTLIMSQFNAKALSRTKMMLSGMLVMGIVLALTGCQFSDNPEAIFKNFHYRLSNSLDIPSDFVINGGAANKDNFIHYPPLKQQLYSIPSANINLIEFLKLSSCELQRHIGQRNSSLGRFMKPSQKLAYEYKFIILAEQCLMQLERGSTLYESLQTVLVHKKVNLERVQWNAIFASDEFSTLFSLSTKPLTLSELKSSPSTLYSALETLSLFVDNKIDDQSVVEDAYAVIASSKYIGQLRLSMKMAVNNLKKSNQLLAYRVDTKVLCFNQQANPRFDIVNTVFMKFYIGEVQPYIALLHQQSKTLLDKVNTLLISLKPKTEFGYFWKQVYLSDESEWQQFEKEIKTHTQYWQQLLKQCGRLPSI